MSRTGTAVYTWNTQYDKVTYTSGDGLVYLCMQCRMFTDDGKCKCHQKEEEVKVVWL